MPSYRKKYFVDFIRICYFHQAFCFLFVFYAISLPKKANVTKLSMGNSKTFTGLSKILGTTTHKNT